MVSAAAMLARGDDLMERASNASSGSRRPNTTGGLNMTGFSERSGLYHASEAKFAHSGSKKLSSMRRSGRQRNSTPGPGAYNVDDSKTAASQGGMGRHGKGGAAYSFGTASRYDDKSKQYLGAGHGHASSMFGHQSPGPATYNTRTKTKKNGFVFPKDASRGMDRGMPCSPGPAYNIGSNKHGAGATAPSYGIKGTGHKAINNPNLASPGPKYLPNTESYSGSKQPAYTFRGGKLRGTERLNGHEGPGPGRYDQKSFNGPGTGSAEWKFGTGTRPPLNDNKDAANNPAPNAYNNTRSASFSGLADPVGGMESMNSSAKRGDGLSTAERFGAAKSGFATSAPGPGAYESHKHLSMGVDYSNMGAAHTMSALNNYGAKKGAAKSPGPKYNLQAVGGIETDKAISFTKDPRGKNVDFYGQSPGPVTAIPGELGDRGNTGAPSYSFTSGWGENPDKQFITKLHQVNARR